MMKPQRLLFRMVPDARFRTVAQIDKSSGGAPAAFGLLSPRMSFAIARCDPEARNRGIECGVESGVRRSVRRFRGLRYSDRRA
jgi:hypothetical protein